MDAKDPQIGQCQYRSLNEYSKNMMERDLISHGEELSKGCEPWREVHNLLGWGLCIRLTPQPQKQNSVANVSPSISINRSPVHGRYLSSSARDHLAHTLPINYHVSGKTGQLKELYQRGRKRRVAEMTY